MLFLANSEAKYFSLKGWTAKSVNSPSGKSPHELMPKHAWDLAAPGGEDNNWPESIRGDDVRLSDIEGRFTCQACGQRGADVRTNFHWEEEARTDA